MRLELKTVITGESFVSSEKFISARKKLFKDDNAITGKRKCLEKILAKSARGHREHEKHKCSQP